MNEDEKRQSRPEPTSNSTSCNMFGNHQVNNQKKASLNKFDRKLDK